MDILKLPLKLFVKIIAVILSIIIIAGILHLNFKGSFFEAFVLTFFGLGSTALLLVLALLLFMFLINLLGKDYKEAFSDLAIVMLSLSIYAIVFLNTIL